MKGNRRKPGKHVHDVTNGGVVQVGVDLLVGALVGWGTTEADSGEDDGRVETETVEGNIEGKPRPSAAEEDLEVTPLLVVADEVAAGGLGHIDALGDVILEALEFTGLDEVGIGDGLCQVALDIHGVARRLWDGETEVEGDDGGDNTKTDDDAPHLVDAGVIILVENG